MADFKIEIKTNFSGLLKKDFNKTMRIFEEELRKVFEEGLAFLESKVKQGTPNWKGHLVDNIARGQIRGSGLGIYGSVFTNVVYGEFIESGFPTHAFPNFYNLADWVRSKLGLEGTDLYLVTRTIARNIANSGILGKHMFEKGWEAGKLEIPKMVEKAEKRIIERWDKE